jgi:hypothetical protein
MDIALSDGVKTCWSIDVRDLKGAGREPVGLTGRFFRRLAKYSAEEGEYGLSQGGDRGGIAGRQVRKERCRTYTFDRWS